MSKAEGAIAGSDAAKGAAEAYARVRQTSDIQYAPINPPANPPLKRTPPEVPEWLKAIGRFFEWIGDAIRSVFEPLGKLLGLSWPVLQWILIGLAVLFVLALLYRSFGHLLRLRKPATAEVESEWIPDRGQAVALLDEADRLAASGEYEAATHLLLQRSVYHIETARPGLLPPASTAREIATHPQLPERARLAFSTIAARVERSLFALRRLDLADWQQARAAYADFALARLDDGARTEAIAPA